MKHPILKLTSVAALLLASQVTAISQEPDPKEAPAPAPPQTPEAAKPAEGSQPETPKDKPAEPELPNILPDPNDPNQTPGIAPVAPKPESRLQAGSDVMDLAFTRVLNDDGTESAVNLVGITLFADTRKSASDPVQRWERAQKEVLVPGVTIVSGLNTPNPEGLRSSLKSYVTRNKPATFRDLQDMVEIIEKHYRENYRPMTHVYIPQQATHSDKVVISIVEGRIGQTSVLTEADLRNKPVAQMTPAEKSFLSRMEEGKTWWNSWYSNPYQVEDLNSELAPRAAQLQGRIVDTEEIKAQITGMNRSPWARLNRPIEHPFRDISVNFSQPAANVVGTTNLVFEVDDRRPVKFFTGVDNALTEVTGENRFFIGGAWYDAFGLGKSHQLGMQVFSALDPSELVGLSFNYQIPWQDQKFDQFTEFFLAYAESETGAVFGGIPTDVGGTSFIFGGRHYLELPEMYGATDMSMPLGALREKKWAKPIREAMGLHHEVGAGLDFKVTDNNLYFGGTTVADSPADIFQFVLEYNARQTDPTGETTLGLQLFLSPGDVTDNNTDEAFAPLRRDAEAAYIYTRIRLDREQDLPFSGAFEGMMLKGSLTGQFSSVNLLASEQLGLGGYASVRGYPERALRGDIGYILNLELYSPEYHPARDWFNFNKYDSLRFLAFVDYAHGESSSDSVSDPLDDPADLMGVGLGVRYEFDETLRLRLDYGFRMEDLPPEADNDDAGAVHFGLVWTF